MPARNPQSQKSKRTLNENKMWIAPLRRHKARHSEEICVQQERWAKQRSVLVTPACLPCTFNNVICKFFKKIPTADLTDMLKNVSKYSMKCPTSLCEGMVVLSLYKKTQIGLLSVHTYIHTYIHTYMFWSLLWSLFRCIVSLGEVEWVTQYSVSIVSLGEVEWVTLGVRDTVQC